MSARLLLLATCTASVIAVGGCEQWLDARADREWQQWQLESEPGHISRVANPE